MFFMHLLFITSSLLLVISCSSNSETLHLEEFIVGKWQARSELNSYSQNGKIANKPHSMEFLEGGKILWDMITPDKTLRFAGKYKFIDNNTIKVDFVRYSNSSAIWDLACSSPSHSRDSITIRDCNVDDVIATMQRVY